MNRRASSLQSQCADLEKELDERTKALATYRGQVSFRKLINNKETPVYYWAHTIPSMIPPRCLSLRCFFVFWCMFFAMVAVVAVATRMFNDTINSSRR